ncbi:MAG: hypothetical protein J0M15_01585 [Deltaproteobacteria bacterium]|jgi:hypothetical protein|nr:hypothetical protein [Deltaproteobacteria bacterium]
MLQFIKSLFWIKLMGCLIFFQNVGFANESKNEPEVAAESSEDKEQQERTKEWLDLTTQIGALKTKMSTQEENIKELIKKKNHSKNKEEIQNAVNNLLKEHAELKKIEEQYFEKTQLLKYRYPDVGITKQRKYERVKTKSLEDYEQMISLESEIKKTVIKMKEHYGVKEIEEPKTKEIKNIDDMEEKNNLSQPVTIRK